MSIQQRFSLSKCIFHHVEEHIFYSAKHFSKKIMVLLFGFCTHNNVHESLQALINRHNLTFHDTYCAIQNDKVPFHVYCQHGHGFRVDNKCCNNFARRIEKNGGDPP